MRPWVMAYYHTLRRLLRPSPPLRRLLVRCRHCGIFFLTAPQNIDRRDLGCPFGCADALRKAASTARVVAYYRTPEGRQKKKAHNRRRYIKRPPQRQPPRPESPMPEPEPRPSPTLVTHLATVATLVEGRRVSHEEIVQLLQKIQRQRSMAHRTHLAYALTQLKENPP